MMTAQRLQQDKTSDPGSTLARILDNIGRVMVGKEDAARLCLVALISGGHVLLEDVPGVGKTMLVRALARSLDCQFKRIQFTPDLLPSDVTGTSIFNQKTGDFEYRLGPIFSQIVLADEINRTSPKTQASLLEALEEKSVSFDGITHALPIPFFVLATQNPIEYEGTFPLPEAQLDRFLVKISIGYPTREQELDVLVRGTTGVVVDDLRPVASPQEICTWQQEAMQVHIEKSLLEYIVEIVTRTRNHQGVYLGVSPRGAIGLARAAQSLSYMQGRDYVIPDDIKYLIPHVLAHRILLHSETRMRGLTTRTILEGILQETQVPIFSARR